ncbi:MAG: tetratricopeptide repeat protein [Bacteroidota bacterium]
MKYSIISAHILLLLTLIVITGVSTFGAGVQVDSLKQLLVKTTESSEKRVDLLNELGYEYWIIDSKQSVAYGDKALQLAEELNYPTGIARAKRILGVAQWTLGQLKPALQNLTASKKLFKQLGDNEGVADCIMNKGMIYAEIKDYGQAMKLYDRAIEIYSSLNLDGRIATTYSKIGMLYIETDQLLSARKYLTDALNIHSDNNFTYGMAESHKNLAKLLIKQGELDMAFHHLRKATRLSTSINDKDGLVSIMVQSGKYFRLQGNFDASEAHLVQALKMANDKQLRDYKLEAYHELKKLNEEHGNLKESLNYYGKYSALKDSIYGIEKSKQIAALEYENELTEKSNELKHMREKEKKNTLIKWLLIISIVVVLGLSIFLYWGLHTKNKKQNELIRSRKEANQVAMENQRMRQEELEQEIEFKNKELAAYTLFFVQKNQLITELKDQVAQIKIAKGNAKQKKIDKLNRELRQQQIIDKDWNDFKRLFEGIHSDFDVKLKNLYPDLSPGDLKLCKLIRLDLNIQQTAEILGISPESVKTARYRLRKKLHLSTDDDLLSQIIKITS